jgi:hypothetical protein
MGLRHHAVARCDRGLVSSVPAEWCGTSSLAIDDKEATYEFAVNRLESRGENERSVLGPVEASKSMLTRVRDPFLYHPEQ